MAHGDHMVWKQTRVPSLSNMRHLGLKKAGWRLVPWAEGEWNAPATLSCFRFFPWRLPSPIVDNLAELVICCWLRNSWTNTAENCIYELASQKFRDLLDTSYTIRPNKLIYLCSLMTLCSSMPFSLSFGYFSKIKSLFDLHWSKTTWVIFNAPLY